MQTLNYLSMFDSQAREPQQIRSYLPKVKTKGFLKKRRLHGNFCGKSVAKNKRLELKHCSEGCLLTLLIISQKFVQHCLAKRSKAIVFLVSQIQNGHATFPAPAMGYMFLLRALFGQYHYNPLFADIQDQISSHQKSEG